MSAPIAAADALITGALITGALGSAEPPPAPDARLVLVAGPELAGATGLAAALRERLPGCTVVEERVEEAIAGTVPAAVVFAVSAVAPLTESDCRLVDAAAADTDLVVGVVTKIDTHRGWREVLAADRELLARHDDRYRSVPWVGAAAAPDLGDPILDELVALLERRLADPDTLRRNRLRGWEVRLQRAVDAGEREVTGHRRRVAALHRDRAAELRRHRLARTEQAIALRGRLQQARVRLAHLARNRTTAMRAELAEDAAGIRRRTRDRFTAHTRDRVGAVIAAVDAAVTDELDRLAAALGLSAPPPAGPPIPPELPGPPLRSRRLEARLTMVLGAGFGLGMALMVTRLVAGLAPGMTTAGVAAGALLGLASTGWLVGVRGLLHDRAVLDRWLSDVAARLRSAVEERVASRVLAAETALAGQLAHREESERARAAERLAAIDAELRRRTAEVAAARERQARRSAPLRAALAAVRAELYGARNRPDAGRGPVERPGTAPETGF
jgi:hypothetical protein